MLVHISISEKDTFIRQQDEVQLPATISQFTTNMLHISEVERILFWEQFMVYYNLVDTVYNNIFVSSTIQ